MDLSFWERDSWFTNIDYTVVGSGIVGLSAALELREQYPSAKILVLERGSLPQGASTKNAGFACFGSLSEILDDLASQSEAEVLALIQKRVSGLQLLRRRLGDAGIGLEPFGGYEIFRDDDDLLYSGCMNRLPLVNELLRPYFKSDVFHKEIDRFGFQHIKESVLFNPFEAQIDTGKMMRALLRKTSESHIDILNGITVTGFHDHGSHVTVAADGFSFKTKKLLFATNGFASALTQNAVRPARAQVLITEPIDNLDIKGTFHIDRGYYYFRNVGNRILLGGGRNTDFETETTATFGLNPNIQKHLEQLLKTVILPGRDIAIAQRWSGIMGMGGDKMPLLEKLSDNVACGVRLGGMGVAIGSLVGAELANLASH